MVIRAVQHAHIFATRRFAAIDINPRKHIHSLRIRYVQANTDFISTGEKPFSSHSLKTEISQEDLQQVRQWKNKLVELRDKYKGTDKQVTFDLELKRTIEFLNKHSNNQ